jgi:hypothetical protein
MSNTSFAVRFAPFGGYGWFRPGAGEPEIRAGG